MQGRERLFNPAQLSDRGDIGQMLRGGLVDRIREEFEFCGDEIEHHAFLCEHSSDSMEFVLEIRVIRALLTGCRRGNVHHQSWNERSSR